MPIDSYGREINYLRISVTDRCNFNCGYCYGDSSFLPKEKILTLEEIAKVAEIAVSIGFKAIKLTGGEPLLRKNISQLVKEIAKLSISDFSLTTNGFNLFDLAQDLKDAGLRRVTVSLDSLNNNNFKKISNSDNFKNVIKGINRAIEVFGEIKINTVLIKGINDEEINPFLDFARSKPIHLRFIELVSNNGPCGIPTSRLKDVIRKELKDIIFLKQKKRKINFSSHESKNNFMYKKTTNGMGPAEVYEIDGFRGSLGFISLKEQEFCNNCNRLRIKANGSIKPCLYNKKEISFLESLRKGDYKEVKRLILDAVKEKPLKSKELITQMRMNGG